MARFDLFDLGVNLSEFRKLQVMQHALVCNLHITYSSLMCVCSHTF